MITAPPQSATTGNASWKAPRLWLLTSGSTAASAGHANPAEKGHAWPQTLVSPFNLVTSDNSVHVIVCAVGPHS